MTIANWCVLAACMLPLFSAALAKGGAAAQARKEGVKKAFDNHHPRTWAASFTGWQQRAYAAQMNTFEALPLFIAAVFLAQQAHGDQGHIDTLALLFIALRIAYLAAYILNWASLRSLIWMGGLACCIGLFVTV